MVLWDVAGSSPKCLESQHYSNTIRKRSDQALTQQLHDTLPLSLTLSLWNKDLIWRDQQSINDRWHPALNPLTLRNMWWRKCFSSDSFHFQPPNELFPFSKAKSTGAGKTQKEITLTGKLKKVLLIWAFVAHSALGLVNEWQMKRGLRTHNSFHRCIGLDA